MKKTALLSTTFIGLLMCIVALGMFSAPLSAAPGQQAAATSTPEIGTTTATATELTTATATELTTATTVISPTTLATTTVTSTAELTPTSSTPSTLPSTGGDGAGGPLALLGIAGVALILAALGLTLTQRGRA